MKKQQNLKKRVYLVDDHPVFRDGVRRMLEGGGEFEVCGEAGSAPDAFEGIRQLKPDLVITDLSLPGKGGLELIQDVHAMNPEMPMLVVSMYDENLFAERVLRAGGRGFVMKLEGPDKIIKAVHKVMSGKVAVSDDMAASLLSAMARPGKKTEASGVGRLSNREMEVLRLIGEGNDTNEIAASLHLSIKTVETHRAHIKTKLGLRNNTQLIVQAARWAGDQS